VKIIPVPDPSLVLLIGAAGAGKTTFAARHFAPDEVLSSDAYRALVSGDEANQKVSRVAFSILHRDLEQRVLAGHLTVVDATNVEPRNRRELIRRAHAAGVPVVALVLDLESAIVLARNATRSRRVDEEVVRWQLERVRTTAGEGVLAGEGCATVWIGRTPEAIDGVAIQRVPSADPAAWPALSRTPPPRPQ
jgi:protein phosphatase